MSEQFKSLSIVDDAIMRVLRAIDDDCYAAAADPVYDPDKRTAEFHFYSPNAHFKLTLTVTKEKDTSLCPTGPLR